MKNQYIVFFIISLFFTLLQPIQGQPNIDEKQWSGIKFRSVGPTRGGRATAITGIPEKPFTFFMGSTGGGVWKTDDAGVSWKNVSDGYFKVGSIGAISVAPSDPNVIYVGTGSAAPRGNISVGDGIYKSTDGGDTWKKIGLEKTGSISQIYIHPNNSDIVFIAALGQIFGPNPERGIYKTTDGGQSWQHILKVDDRTGAVDLVANPANPREMYAAFWQVERKPWTLIDGGENGGVWKTYDGGTNWKKLSGGLPNGVLGRIGLAISPVNPNKVWAMVNTKEEKDGGLYQSVDAGRNWKKVNRNHKLRQRAWYYTHLTAHPTEENSLFISNTGFYKSIDGGKNFDVRIRTPHGDNHGVWINPNHPEIMINCNDGGANISLNAGKTWSSQNNQPTSEFYRVAVDNQFPYRIYAAQQDNSTISVPSKFESALTPQQQWFAVGGGESGHIAVDPNDPNIIYAGTYIGQITRMDKSKGHTKDIVIYPQMHDGQAPREIKYRFQWNAPIRISPHNPNVVYHCSQYVHKTQDGGFTWETISPDLTTNKDEYHDIPGGPIQHDHTGVELYTTIFAFEESPLQEGELWAGSDDGLLHISQDGGQNWKNITPKNMPMEGTINTIELSTHKKGKAFITVYKYRENDFTPYLFKTEDYGNSWELITKGIPSNHFLRVVREDPVREGLLYAGSEFGFYISFDEGSNWHSFQRNLPITPITDMVVKGSDLVIATQGRSFWILDDLTPLRVFNDNMQKEPVYLFQPNSAYRTQFRNHRGVSAPDPAPNGAILYFYVNETKKNEPVTLTIKDDTKKVRRTFSVNAKGRGNQLKVSSGLNRFIWDMKYERPEVQPKAVFSLANMGGVLAKPGKHYAEISMGDQKIEVEFLVKKDPRWSQTNEDLLAQYQLAMDVKTLFNDCHNTIGSLRSIREQINFIGKNLKSNDVEFPFKEKTKSIITSLKEIEDKLIQTQSESGQDPINYPSMLDDQIAYLYSFVNYLDSRPNEGAYLRYKDLKATFTSYKESFQKLLDNEVKALNESLKSANITNIIFK